MTPTPSLTRHAVFRSHTRQIPLRKIEAVLRYGRFRHARGAEVYTLGWREVRRWAEHGIDLSRLEGIEVICGHDGRVITVYRNRKPFQTRDRALRRAA